MPDTLSTPPCDAAGRAFEDQVLAVLEEVRPALKADGGDVELVRADPATGRVEVRLVGACRHCAASSLTLSYGVEARLRQALPAVTELVALTS